MSTGHFGRAVPVGLRRFPFLHGKTLAGRKFVFPSDLQPIDAPFHVTTINFRNKHVWNARTWGGLYSSLQLLGVHNGNPPGSLLHLFVFPSLHLLWAPLWRRRCRAWAEENHIPMDKVVVVYGNRDAICDDIGVFNDGRQYGFIIKNSGKVLFAADGRYISQKHDLAIHKAIRSSSDDNEKLG
jgi:hypothetical protein